MDYPTTKNIIELIRVSTESQALADRAGIPAQKAINQRTIQAFGLRKVRTIEMVDVSGAAVMAAPEMTELLRLMESPYIHGVVAKEFSRLMRPENFSDFVLLQAFIDTKTVLYLPEGPIDFASKTGRLMGTIRAAIAGLERTEILERVWSAKEEKRRAGGHPNSWITLPYGVGYDKQRGWHYTAEAEKVREAVRLFLSGQTSYKAVGEQLGIDAFNLRVILRNAIYAGWRVYTKRRDPSPAAKCSKPNGRQGDKPKINRAPDDVIRVKVMDGIVTEEEFTQLQRILDLKRARHWRTRTDYVHRFTYNGFLVCGRCGELIYTHKRRADYYVCKNRRLTRAGQGCPNPFMRRDKLEVTLDSLFADRLTNRTFLEELAAQFHNHADPTHTDHVVRLDEQLHALRAKRDRVLSAFFDGVITREERDAQLSVIERDERVYGELLTQQAPQAEINASALAQAFAPFCEWKFLSRDHKRRLLSAITPEIHVDDYRVSGVTIISGLQRCDEVNPTGKDSSRRPA